MANITKKQLEAMLEEQRQIMVQQQAQIDALVAAAAKKTAKPEKPIVGACPDYATAAQRVEYEKLAKRALEILPDVKKAAKTESVSVFIPVAKDKPEAMPHSIRFTAKYSK